MVSRQQFFLWARVVFGVLLCVVLLWLVDPSKLIELIPQMRGDWALASIVAYIVAIVFNVAGIQHILRSLAHQMAISSLVAIHLQGVFFNYFLPTNFGGDIYKVMSIGGRVGSTSGAVVAVVLQRSISLIAALVMIAVGVSFFSPASVELAGGTVFVCAGLAVLLILAALVRIPKSLTRWARGHRWVKRVLERWGALFMAAHELRKPIIIAATVGLLFISQCLAILGAIAMARCLSIEIGWQHFVYVVPLSYLAGVAPVSINGLGVREGAVVLLLTQLGVDRTTAAAFALSILGVNMLFALVGGLLFTLGRREETEQS